MRLDASPGAVSNLTVRLVEPGVYVYHCAFPDVPTHLSDGLEEPTSVVFNGRPGALTGNGALGAGGSVQAGDSVRLFVGNAGPNLVSSFHVIGEILDRVYVEGSFGLVNTDVQTTLVPSGGAVAVEFTVDVPGDYLLVDHSLFRLHKGAAGILTVGGDPRPDLYDPKVSSEDARGETSHEGHDH